MYGPAGHSVFQSVGVRARAGVKCTKTWAGREDDPLLSPPPLPPSAASDARFCPPNLIDGCRCCCCAAAADIFESNQKKKLRPSTTPSLSAKRHIARDQKILEHRTEQRVTEKVRDLNSPIVTTCM
ncbi:uncharacterized protein H6S33_004588 [Morchella sextelata]|uniref:uncharacterized protein n=1 Tax=Morchella sextelata TaxID=1174677 RepID=UPI001D04D480|nr:uncharacterized protein H6S33_004588 [Morchella sextelata]KAH0605366.1 hypothetical protein H6S33_004588 [Morchella sextelata]